MAKYIFPAKFTWVESDKVYHVEFPDLENVFTDGHTKEEALENATDALNLMLYDEEVENIPQPTDINDIEAPINGFTSLVLADTEAYKEVIERENNPIKYARKKAKLNIKQLAELLEAPYRTIQDYDNGKTKPSKWVEKLIIEKIESVV